MGANSFHLKAMFTLAMDTMTPLFSRSHDQILKGHKNEIYTLPTMHQMIQIQTLNLIQNLISCPNSDINTCIW